MNWTIELLEYIPKSIVKLVLLPITDQAPGTPLEDIHDAVKDNFLYIDPEKLHEYILQYAPLAIEPGASYTSYHTEELVTIGERYQLASFNPHGGWYAGDHTGIDWSREVDGVLRTPGIFSSFELTYTPIAEDKVLPAVSDLLMVGTLNQSVSAVRVMRFVGRWNYLTREQEPSGWILPHVGNYYEVNMLWRPWLTEFDTIESYKSQACYEQDPYEVTFAHFLAATGDVAFCLVKHAEIPGMIETPSPEDAWQAKININAPYHQTMSYNVVPSQRLLLYQYYNLRCEEPLWDSPYSAGGDEALNGIGIPVRTYIGGIQIRRAYSHIIAAAAGGLLSPLAQAVLSVAGVSGAGGGRGGRK